MYVFMEYQKKRLNTLKINDRKQTTDPENSENTQQNKYQKYDRHIIIKLLKTKTNKKLKKGTDGKISPCLD